MSYNDTVLDISIGIQHTVFICLRKGGPLNRFHRCHRLEERDYYSFLLVVGYE